MDSLLLALASPFYFWIANDMGELAYTEKRKDPGLTDPDTFWEHVRRRRFTSGFSKGSDIFAVTRSEGYGITALRQSGAPSVVKVDIALEAVHHSGQRLPLLSILGHYFHWHEKKSASNDTQESG